MPMDRFTGERISIASHVDQCVQNVLQTPLQSRPMAPLYGSDLLELADIPLGRVGQARVKAATAEAVTKFEDRPAYDRVSTEVEGAGSVIVTVYWSLDSTAFTTTISA